MLKFLEPYLFWIKIGLGALFIAAWGYTYLWTYNQGKANGTADMVKVQAQAMAEFQKKSAAEAAALRDKEMKEARAIYEQQLKEITRKASDLKKANDLLKKEPAAAAVVPPSIISLLNSAGTSPTPKT